MKMRNRIAVIAGVVMMATAVSAAIIDQPAPHRVAAAQQAVAVPSKEVSNAELIALWRQVPTSNIGPVSYRRPQ